MDKGNLDNSDKNGAKKRKLATPKEQTISFRCEWADCTFNSEDQPSFIDHVENHAPQLEVREVDGRTLRLYCCMWECCGFDSENLEVTRYHINYHGYHTQIKALGNQLLTENPTLCCSLDFDGRNLLPVLPSQRQCEWYMCQFHTNSFQRLIEHVFKSHIAGQPSRTWREPVNCEWKGCDKRLKGLTQLKVHIKCHTQEKTMGCPVCGNQFASKQKLSDHFVRQVPQSARNYKCSYCKKYFPSERFLQEHIRLHLNIFKCPFCDMTCAFKTSLSKHILFRHLNDFPFKCNFCDHRSKTEGNMEKHYETHCSENVWICEREGCDFSCRSKNGLTTHYSKAHPKETVPAVYVCHICERRCNRGFDLTRHLRAKHNYRCAPGQARFRYIKDDNGEYRLQVVRYESIEVTQQVTALNSDNESRSRAPKKFTCLGITSNKYVITEDMAANMSCEPIESDIDDPEEAGDMVILEESDSEVAASILENSPTTYRIYSENNDTAENKIGMGNLFPDESNERTGNETNQKTTNFEDSEPNSTINIEDYKESIESTDDDDCDFEESLQKSLGIKDGTGFVKVIKTL